MPGLTIGIPERVYEQAAKREQHLLCVVAVPLGNSGGRPMGVVVGIDPAVAIELGKQLDALAGESGFTERLLAAISAVVNEQETDE